MKKVLNILLGLLIIATVVVIILIIVKYSNNQANERALEKVLEQIKSEANINTQDVQEDQKTEIEYKGYKVVGTIKISKINIEYPILEITTSGSMKYSITKFWGDKINEVGNVCFAGHNNYDGTMFGKTKELEVGDTFELTDTDNITKTYKIFKKYITDPDDISVIETEEFGTREATLITCSNGNRERLILKAREEK
ncbi:MAG: sortase [Clostridia bacterium]|nr:sortase [Clostridia bacterium]